LRKVFIVCPGTCDQSVKGGVEGGVEKLPLRMLVVKFDYLARANGEGNPLDESGGDCPHFGVVENHRVRFVA